MIVLILLYLTATIESAKMIDPKYILRDGPQHFQDFIDAHNKIYSSEQEKTRRYGIFLQNLEEINNLNDLHEHAEFGVNAYSDLTSEEFVSIHTCFNASDEEIRDCRKVTSEDRHEELGIPSELDWRAKNVVARVKKQGNCGACWAFSAIGNVESVNAIKTGQLLELSEQQLVDCDKSDHGCEGGYTKSALKYLMDEGAIPSSSYPYEETQRTCRYDSGKVAVNVTGCLVIDGSEELIAEQLATIGPLSLAIDASGVQHSNGGILHGQTCNRKSVNHAVLLIGYGVDVKSGLPYWLLKNSWGSSHSYIKMERGVNCLNMLQYPPVSAVVG